MDSIPLQVVLQFILILLNAFFAASEIAIISLNQNKLQYQADSGDKVAARLLKFAKSPTNFLSTIQIGITLAGFLGSAFASANFASLIVNLVCDVWQINVSREIVNTISVILITIILSYFTLVLGELVPKRIAMQKPYQVAKFTSRIIGFLAIVMKPFIWFISKSTSLVLRLFRIKNNQVDEEVTENDIKMMVDIGEEHGNIEEQEKEWIENIFEFNDRVVREVMRLNYQVSYLTLDLNKDEIFNIIKKENYSRYPICKNNLDDVVGILHIKDYFLNPDKSLIELMRKPLFILETMSTDEAFKKMQSENVAFAVVIDEHGSVSGILTIEDLIEEVLGNIYDEHDEITDKIKRIDDNVFQLNGDVTILELEEVLGVNIDTNYDTVGGLILGALDDIPVDNTKFSVVVSNLEFQIEKFQQRRVILATVHLLKINDDSM